MSKQKHRHSHKQVEPRANNVLRTMNTDECMEDVSGIAESLKELKQFHMETSVNFGTLKKEMNELQEDLKKRMDAAELKISENEDHEMNITEVWIQTL